jgi:arylsulfatase
MSAKSPFAVVASSFASVVLFFAANSNAANRPNIVLIMADDMGYSDIGCYGGETRTPNLDRLAAGGLRFTQFYNTGRCCPTRASLLTGLYPHETGVGHMTGDYGLPGYRGDLNDECLTIAEVLRAAGYRTYMSGKWHVTRQVGYWEGNENRTSKDNWPRQRGFHRFFGTIHGAGSFYDPVSLTLENTPTVPPGKGFFYTDAINDTTVDYIQEHNRVWPDKPFFCYVAHTAPHWPLHAKPEDIAKYDGVFDDGWDAIRERRIQRMREMGLISDEWPLTPRDENVPAWTDAENKEWQTRRMETYAAQIDCMDQGIGRIVATLEETGQLDNTLILFLADNGGCAERLSTNWKGLHIPNATLHGEPVQVDNDPDVMPGPETTYQSYGPGWANASNTPFRRFKHWVHEGGIATPLIAHWPKTLSRKGELDHTPGHLVDIMRTCIDVADAAYPKAVAGKPVRPMRGASLAPAFTGDAVERTEPIFWEHEGNRAVRDGKWKAVSRHPGDWELYDMKADRTELNNLATNHGAKLAELVAAYDAWAARSYVAPWRSWVKKK